MKWRFPHWFQGLKDYASWMGTNDSYAPTDSSGDGQGCGRGSAGAKSTGNGAGCGNGYTNGRGHGDGDDGGLPGTLDYPEQFLPREDT